MQHGADHRFHDAVAMLEFVKRLLPHGSWTMHEQMLVPLSPHIRTVQAPRAETAAPTALLSAVAAPAGPTAEPSLLAAPAPVAAREPAVVPIAAAAALVALGAGGAVAYSVRHHAAHGEAVSGTASVEPTPGPLPLGLGFGFLGQAHVAYELESGVLLGLEGGYLTASQHVTGHSASLTPVGRPANKGTLDDALRLSGLTVGATGGWHSRKSFPVVTLRLGAGALLGSLDDQRRGAFTSSAGTPYEKAVGAAPGATYFYVAPEARIGVRLVDRFELSLGAQGVLLFALSKPVTSTRSETTIPDDGRATFGFEQDEALAGGAMFLLVPSLGLRTDF